MSCSFNSRWYMTSYMITRSLLVLTVFNSLRLVNTLRPRQDGRLFPDDILKCIFLNENELISIKISLKFVHKGPINNNPSLVQIMAWRRSGDKPLSEPMMVSVLTHICVTLPHWVNSLAGRSENDFRSITCKLIFRSDISSNSYEIALWSMPENPTDDKSTLVQVMAWCHQATSHYLSQCWQ